MRKFASHEVRLRGIEGERGEVSMVLRFADGSSRGVYIRHDHRLRLLLDSFDRALAFPPPTPEGEIPIPERPEPATESDSLLILMENAASIETNDRLFKTIFGLCQSTGQSRKQSFPTVPATPESLAGSK